MMGVSHPRFFAARTKFECLHLHLLFLHQLLAAGEGGGDGCAHDAVDVLTGVEADGLHLRGVGFAVRERRLIDRAIDDLPDDIAVLFVHRDKLAFKDKRQFVDDGSIDKLALRQRKAALRHFVWRLVAADDSQIVACRDLVRRSERDGERLSRGDVAPSLVRSVDAEGSSSFYFSFLLDHK